MLQDLRNTVVYFIYIYEVARLQDDKEGGLDIYTTRQSKTSKKHQSETLRISIFLNIKLYSELIDIMSHNSYGDKLASIILVDHMRFLLLE